MKERRKIKRQYGRREYSADDDTGKEEEDYTTMAMTVTATVLQRLWEEEEET